MDKFKQLQKIKSLYANGENIIQFLKGMNGNAANTIEDILISYDFQAGSYVEWCSANKSVIDNYSKALSVLIDKFDNVQSLMEIGVGEGTTLKAVVENLKSKPASIFGLDVSWSRLKFGKNYLKDFGLGDAKLFTANLFEIPLQDNSIDVVYTSHSVEPNGGKEEEALKELYRVTKKYLVLLEPAYELASEEARARMKQHGYVTNLYDTAKRLGYKVIEHRLFDYNTNPLNPTGLIIIEKNAAESNDAALVCPISRTSLQPHGDSLLYSGDSFLAYPVVDGIPCLLKENSILATHLLTDYKTYLKDHHIAY